MTWTLVDRSQFACEREATWITLVATCGRTVLLLLMERTKESTKLKLQMHLECYVHAALGTSSLQSEEGVSDTRSMDARDLDKEVGWK